MLDTFTNVADILDNLPVVEDEWVASLVQVQQSDLECDKDALLAHFPNLSPSEFSQDVENFCKYYQNIKTDDEGIGDVFQAELDKRKILYEALANMPDIAPSMGHLLFSLGAKTFVVACYAAMQGCQLAPPAETSIFTARPGLGVDVTDVFDDCLFHYYVQGGALLGLPREFLENLSNDCISFHELQLLATML